MSTEMEFGNKSCPQYEALLEDYLDGALSTAEANTAELHLRNCAACQSALEQASASVRLLRIVEPSEGPGPAFARTVMARIRSAENDGIAERARFWQPLVRVGWQFAATAALALCVLVTYDAGWGRHTQSDLQTVGPTAMNDIFAPDPVNPPASRDEVLMMEAEANHAN